LRQARSILDGDIGAVVADNRFAVLNVDRRGVKVVAAQSTAGIG
jgi:hypothetical protein